MIKQPGPSDFPKFQVHIPVTLRLSGEAGSENVLRARSLQMSLNEVHCNVNQYIPVSENVQVTFGVSDTPSEAGSISLQCEGTVVRISPEAEEEAQTEYRVGIRFDNLSQAEQSILRIIISTARLTNPKTSSVSVVVPVYNGQRTLRELTNRLQATLAPLVECFEIILVNDCSQDESWNEIIRLAEQNAHVRGINLMRNYGQHNALLAGIQRAQSEIIVTIDDDLQHPPEEIPKLLSKLTEGYDVVYGKPTYRHHAFWRNLSSKILKSSIKIVLGANMGSHSSSFRAFRSNLRQGFERFADAQLALDVLLSWGAARVTHIAVDHHAREHGRSGYTMRKLLLLSFNMLTGYSTLPLRVASSVGLATSLFGLGMFFYVVVRRLFQTNYVPGFAFISAEIALFAGLQLFAIGVIGEYVARLHFRTMGKPPYVIRDAIVDETGGGYVPGELCKEGTKT